MAVILSVDYDEGIPGTYRSVELQLNTSLDRPRPTSALLGRYATGDVISDMAEAVAFAVEIGADLFVSSSIDQFVMDDETYKLDSQGFIVSA